MTEAQHYDVIVVGTGAGGGTIAHRPVPTGKRILLPERGDHLPRERDNWDSTAVFVKGKYRAPEFRFDKHGEAESVNSVVACGSVNSAVLLPRSANDRHPQGPADSSDAVGRHSMRHDNLALMAVSEEPHDTRFQMTLAPHDWYLGSDDWEYPLGGIQMLGRSDSEQIHDEAPRRPGAVCSDMPFEVPAHHAVGFWLCGEDLPTPGNRVTPDRDGGVHLALAEKYNIVGDRIADRPR